MNFWCEQYWTEHVTSDEVLHSLNCTPLVRVIRIPQGVESHRLYTVRSIMATPRNINNFQVRMCDEEDNFYSIIVKAVSTQKRHQLLHTLNMLMTKADADEKTLNAYAIGMYGQTESGDCELDVNEIKIVFRMLSD